MNKKRIGVFLTLALITTNTSNMAFATSSTTKQKSTMPTAITVVNNATGTKDSVEVDELSTGDVVKIYSTGTSTKVLGTATVGRKATSSIVSINQLGQSSGTVYVTVTSSGKSESDRASSTYDAEPISNAPGADSVTVINNPTGTKDTIIATGLSYGDEIYAYSAATGGRSIGSSKVSKDATSATISIAQLSPKGAAGIVYISVKKANEDESTRTAVEYGTEGSYQSTQLDAANITITNNAVGTKDTVAVSNLSAGDVINIYATKTGGKSLGSASASDGTATVSINQLGKNKGTVYVTVTSTGKYESTRTTKDYDTEATSTAPDAKNITVTNNAIGTKDIVIVSNLSAGDIVNVYSVKTGGKSLGSAAASDGTATVSIDQLGKNRGTVYVTVTSTCKNESTRTPEAYDAELTQSTTPDAKNIIVVNSITGVADSVIVEGLTTGDIVNVYSAKTGGKLLGSATAHDDVATVSIDQLGKEAGTVYVTVTGTGKVESMRTAKAYDAEATSIAPDAKNVTVTNTVTGIPDTVTVTGLTDGDYVHVYSTEIGEKILNGANAIDGTATVSIQQLGKEAGTVYVTVTSRGKNESDRTAKTYEAEATSTAPDANNITVTNNALERQDTVTVTGLTKGDVVYVYSAETDGQLLGCAIDNDGTATLSIDQLSKEAGTVYVTVKNIDKDESSRTAKAYDAEATSTAPDANNITATNNITGVMDSIAVTGLNDDDIINIYSEATGGQSLASTLASEGVATIPLDQLSKEAGTIYVTVTSPGKYESPRTAKAYDAEPVSTAPNADNITIEYSIFPEECDSITVTGLTAGDTVWLYLSESGIDLPLIGGIVGANDTYTTIGIPRLDKKIDKIYVSVKSIGKDESDRTAISYTQN